MSIVEVTRLRLEEFIELSWVDIMESERSYVERQLSSIAAISSVVEMAFTGRSGYVEELSSYLEESKDKVSKEGGCTSEEYTELSEHFKRVREVI